MNLQNLTGSPDNVMPVIRVYKNTVQLNRRACLLLGLAPHSRVNVVTDTDTGKIYIHRSEDPASYRLNNFKGRFGKRINSTKLATALCEALGGQGAYRIDENWAGTNRHAESLHEIIATAVS